MAIKIQTEKVIQRGVALRKVIKLEALSNNDLPKEYEDGAPYCYLCPSGELYVNNGRYTHYVCLSTYEESRFQEILVDLEACGKRLQKINTAIRELEKVWHGAETFII